MNGRKVAFGILMLVTLTVGAYWASLVLSLNGLEAAVRDRDVIKLEKYIDWVRLREQARSEIKGLVTANLFNQATQKSENASALFGTLVAGAIAPGMIDQLVNDLVTARSLATLLGDKNIALKQGFSIKRIGLTDIDEYTLVATNGKLQPDQEFRLILRREGITWRAAAIVLPDQFWEQLAPGPERRAPSAEELLRIVDPKAAAKADAEKAMRALQTPAPTAAPTPQEAPAPPSYRAGDKRELDRLIGTQR